ncbi:MAG: AMP-binding protein, partial [Acidobacteriota bacterium]
MKEESLPLDFFQQFRKVLARLPDRIAFQSLAKAGKETITYGQVDLEIRVISQYLSAHGVGPRSKVGLILENHPRWGIAFLAVQSAGAVIVPLDILHSPETLARLIQHAGCDYLIASSKLFETLEQVQRILPGRLPAIVIGEGRGLYPSWDEILQEEYSADVTIPLVPRGIDDPHVILYTSGTTGEPKGVVLTGRNLYRNVVEALKQIQVTPEDHFLGVLPLYHIFALIVNFIAPLYCGARTTFLDVIDAQRILKTFREEGITIFVCVPQFYYLLHRRILSGVAERPGMQRFIFRRMLAVSRLARRLFGARPGRRLFKALHRQFGDHLRFFGVGGARFDRQVAETLADLGFTIIQAYGMTETAALATLTPIGAAGIGSVGKPLPHCEIRIDDPDRTGIGNVLIRGENVMKEYYRNPAATREAIDEEGWLHSGDLGYIDSEGFLHITGRAKDVIVLSSGKNIYPEEIEHFYESNCPLIKELCVVGIRDETSPTAERLHAVVVPDFDEIRQQKIVNAYNMIRYLVETLSQQLPPHKRVHSLEIRQEPLPRTTTRKIKRFEVEQQLGQGRPNGVNGAEVLWEPADETEEEIVTLLEHVKSIGPLSPEMNLELDLGLDSLERVEFLSTLQQSFQLTIPEEEAARLLTLQDVIEAVRANLDRPSSGAVGKRSWSDILDEPLGEDVPKRYLSVLRRRPLVEPLVLLIAKSVKLTGKVFFRVRAEGLENLPDDYPYLICPNHLSFLDAFLVVAVLPNRVVRRSFSLGYSDYFASGLTAFFGGIVRTIPVTADRNLAMTLRLAAEGLRRELVLVVFPEGERSIDGRLKPFRKGPAILATKLSIPVVPVGIRGSYEAWPRGASRIRMHPIAIRFGRPIQPARDESIEDFNHRLRQAVA